VRGGDSRDSGTAFRVEANGDIKTIHSFRFREGSSPLGLVAGKDGYLYGTAETGGDPGSYGTVFRMTLAGDLTTLHRFTSEFSGAFPGVLSTGPDGSLFGTTAEFGLCGGGSIFQITADDHRFATMAELCSKPQSPLLFSSDGNLYGSRGGVSGSIFRASTFGEVTSIRRFGDSPTGYFPNGGLLEGPDGYLYGAFAGGGVHGRGLIFRLSRAGSFRVLHTFSEPDGGRPNGSLMWASDGNLYGTTDGLGPDEFGTIFRLGIYGDFETLHVFNGLDGMSPSPLVEVSDGNIYGTTSMGGSGSGVLFRIVTPPRVASIVPGSGSYGGGTLMTITGGHFDSSVTLTVGGSAAGISRSSPTELIATSPALGPGTVNDVVVWSHLSAAATLVRGWFSDFLDVPQTYPFHSAVESLVRNRVASGYGNGFFGRDDPVKRSHMAIMLLKAARGPGFDPGPCSGVFGDVRCDFDFGATWIGVLYYEGITRGCNESPPRFCPEALVTRAEMAPLLIRAKHGSDYAPPPATGNLFSDVPAGGSFADWIEQLAAEGIATGCGGGKYCPEKLVTRGELAAFLKRAFDLP
jgi:uncharacterized repeat protein (TIGR03803 family)